MTDPDDDPVEEILARSRDRAERFRAWLEQLRAGDPTFAEASALYPSDMTEWQSAVYLLTGCDEVWRALGPRVLAERSIGPVHHELENPRRPWSGSEDAVMQWFASSERLSRLCLADRMQLRPGLSHKPLLLEALRDAVQAARVLQPKPCCRLGERDARLLADEREEIVSPAALASAI